MQTYRSASYKFTLGDLAFTVDIEESLYAPKRKKEHLDKTPKALHYHPMHEMFFVAGDERLTASTEDGETVFSGEVLAVPPFYNHLFMREHDYHLFFSFRKTKEEDSPLARFFERSFSEGKITRLCSLTPALSAYLEELASIFYSENEAQREELAVSLLKLILYRIYSESKEKSDERAHARRESYYSIISRMLASCSVPGSDLTLASISKELHLGEKQCARIVKKYYSKPLSEVVLEEKLLRAAYLLSTTDLPIARISAESNFRSENYFFISFKKRFSMTPLQYRKSRR